MSLYASFKRYQQFYAAVSYCFLNEKVYAEWDRRPNARDMLRITHTYERIQNDLNRLFERYTKNVEFKYTNK